MGTSGKRAFWMHQGAEYLIGLSFVAIGVQSPTPIVPTLMGGLILLNTAFAKGPLSAFQVFGRRTHRILDAILVLVAIFVAVQPWVEIENGTRFVMLLLAGCMGVIWMQSDFSERVKKPRRGSTPVASSEAPSEAPSVSATPSQPDGSTADNIGRSAGRLAGKGVNMYRSRRAASANKQEP